MKSSATLPQGLYRSRPREVRLSMRGRVLAATAILLCVSALPVALLTHRKALAEHSDRDALLARGVVTTGVVTRLARESKDSKRSTVYYRFDANARTFNDREKVPLAMWDTLSVGSSLPIRYLDSDPANNTADGVIPKVMPLWLGTTFGVVLLLLAGGFSLGLWYQRRLLSEGRAAIAIVKDVKKHRGQHGSYNTVRYEFPLSSGAIQAGSTNVTSAPPVVGASIAVVYDDERPRRSRLYPLSLVQLAESDS